MPSLMPAKKPVMRLMVSSNVRSLPRPRASMLLPSLCSGSRKGAPSMKPEVGKFSSKRSIRRISSVRARRFRMAPGEVENFSCATRAAA